MKLVLRSNTLIDSRYSSHQLQDLLLSLRHLELKPVIPSFSLPKISLDPSQSILIYGDYDVDGITATAILWQALSRHGLRVTPFIPHREHDGYGFKADSFFRFQQEKGITFDTLITVDNGIVAISEFKKLKNIKIIVVDHHLADANIDNLRSMVDSLIHSPDLSAAGLAYFIAQQFDPHPDLGLAALGTVADCLPLLGVNRSIVYHGLRQLRLNPSPGIKKLIDVSRAKIDSLSTYDLGFLLGPRINAVGRLSDSMDALRLLCASNLATAGKYATVLNQHNQDRQILQQRDLVSAEEQIVRADHGVRPTSIFVTGDYNPGIIGLIAGRLTEKYYLPSIVIALNGDVAKGSCRSIKELNIIETLRQTSDLLVDVGGHPAAAGFSIKTINIPKFQQKITNIVNQKLNSQILEPTLEVDAEMKLVAVNVNNIKVIKQFEPFGVGNPEPLFLFKNIRVVSKKLLGTNQDHLKLKLDDPETQKIENISTDAIAFKKGDYDAKIKVGDLISLIAKLDLNIWNGITISQLVVKDIILE